MPILCRKAWTISGKSALRVLAKVFAILVCYDEDLVQPLDYDKELVLQPCWVSGGRGRAQTDRSDRD